MYMAKNLGMAKRHARSAYHMLNFGFVETRRTFIPSKRAAGEKAHSLQISKNAHSAWPQTIFSGVQPTGPLHLGNYLGTINKWRELQDTKENAIYCIADMHSITVKQNPNELRENIFRVAATLLACGIKPEKATLFVQSAVKEHTHLNCILGNLVTMAKLGHLPHCRKKSRSFQDVSLGLYMYPLLQAADVLLYKATGVPVGGDQVPHIQLIQYVASMFNNRYGPTFPICEPLLENRSISSIQSLRDPTKKMSKSDSDHKATIFLVDEPEVIRDKVKRATTDFQSDVTYNVERRAGISNLIAIHAFICGVSVEDIVANARNMDTAKYKLEVADCIIEHLKPIRQATLRHLSRRNDLMHILETGCRKAQTVAQKNLEEVLQRIGLGANHVPVLLDHRTVKVDPVPSLPSMGICNAGRQQKVGVPNMVNGELINMRPALRPKPIVPQQPMRIEKDKYGATPMHNSMNSFNLADSLPSVAISPTRRTDYRHMFGTNINTEQHQHGHEYLKRIAAAKMSPPPPKYPTTERRFTQPVRKPMPASTSAAAAYSYAYQNPNQGYFNRSRGQNYLAVSAEARNKNYGNNNTSAAPYAGTGALKITPGKLKFNRTSDELAKNATETDYAKVTPSNLKSEKDIILNQLQEDLRLALKDNNMEKTLQLIKAVERLKEVIGQTQQQGSPLAPVQVLATEASKHDSVAAKQTALVTSNWSADLMPVTKSLMPTKSDELPSKIIAKPSDTDALILAPNRNELPSQKTDAPTPDSNDINAQQPTVPKNLCFQNVDNLKSVNNPADSAAVSNKLEPRNDISKNNTSSKATDGNIEKNSPKK